MALESDDLSFDDDTREAGLERSPDLRRQFGYGNHSGAVGLLHARRILFSSVAEDNDGTELRSATLTIKKLPMKVLFVCLGNICRSPLAEGLFRKLVAEAGRADEFEIDSAGTGGWHVGERPDRRMRETAARHGVDLSDIRARRFDRDDLDDFDLILAMDRDNLRDILRVASPEQRAKVRLFRSYDDDPGGALDVPDPYYGGSDGFERVFRIVERTSRNLLEASSA